MSILGDITKSINKTKENLMQNENSQELKKEYSNFLMNRIYSYFPDTIYIVSELNRHPNLDKELHYKFLLNTVPVKYRFKQMVKKDNDDDVEFIMKHFNYSHIKAKNALKLLTEDQISDIKLKMTKGEKIT